MDMTHVVVVFGDNWADEMDISGVRIFTSEEWQEIQDRIPDKPFNIYIGSNQDIEYESKQDYLSNFEATPITAEQAAWLQSILGTRFGHFPNPEFE
jgi:hypothetical protein